MHRKKISDVFMRLLVTLIGAAFITWGLMTIALGFFGAKSIGTIDAIRREPGKQNETIPKRYTYAIS